MDELLKELCNALRDLWVLDSFREPYRINHRGQRAKTTVDSDLNLTPAAKNPIRGCSGVEVEISEDNSINSIKRNTYSILISQTRPESYQTQAVQDALKKVNQAIEKIGILVDNDSKLSYRLYGAIGYKSFSQKDFLEMQKKENWNPEIAYFLSIADLLSSELTVHGFKPEERSKFSKWHDVIENSAQKLHKLRLEENYHYEVHIFLNGPLLDIKKDVLIANLLLDNYPLEISLGYATDEIITSLVENDKHPAIERINTVIKYKVNIPIEAGEESYLIQYHNASLLAQILLDSLRLCRPLDDIGVLAIEVLPLSFSAPRIRKTWAGQFHDELARFEPKRFDFSPASPFPLTSLEIEKVKSIVQLMLPSKDSQWNLEYALRRFRNSTERYSVDDSERLLEYAIALESLYLNDNSGNRGELTYRLSLRAARFLEQNLEKRKEIFFAVNKLYGFRSRIAHGEDISRLKRQKDNDDLKQILKVIPAIVAESIIRLMAVREENPAMNISDFWREIELGS